MDYVFVEDVDEEGGEGECGNERAGGDWHSFAIYQ